MDNTHKNLIMNLKEILEIKMQNYTDAKIQSQDIDNLIGFNCFEIENKILKNKDSAQFDEKNFWLGLDIQSLQTPYSEIVEMVEVLNPQDNEFWIDLGAAYGRIGIVLALLKPNVRFEGYEYILDRAEEGNRIFKKLDISTALLKCEDISLETFELKSADVYFIYDFGSKSDVYKTLEKLRLVAQTKPIRLIARGRGIKNWILYDFPWLHQIKPPKYFQNWTLFES